MADIHPVHFQQFGDHVDVPDLWDVAKYGRLFGQECCDHGLGNKVLCSPDKNLALERLTASDLKH